MYLFTSRKCSLDVIPDKKFFLTLYCTFLFALRISEIQKIIVFQDPDNTPIIQTIRKFGKLSQFYPDFFLKKIINKFNITDFFLKPHTFRRLLKKKFCICPHDLRRMIATYIFSQKQDILEVQRRLDHASPKTSWEYIRTLKDHTPKSFQL